MSHSVALSSLTLHAQIQSGFKGKAFIRTWDPSLVRLSHLGMPLLIGSEAGGNLYTSDAQNVVHMAASSASLGSLRSGFTPDPMNQQLWGQGVEPRNLGYNIPEAH